MHTRAKLLMAALTAALALSLATSTASALRNSLLVEGSNTVSSSGIITFEKAGVSTIECPATIVKTISQVIPKRLGVLLGGIRAPNKMSGVVGVVGGRRARSRV